MLGRTWQARRRPTVVPGEPAQPICLPLLGRADVVQQRLDGRARIVRIEGTQRLQRQAIRTVGIRALGVPVCNRRQNGSASAASRRVKDVSDVPLLVDTLMLETW